jgi:hypothetical protein
MIGPHLGIGDLIEGGLSQLRKHWVAVTVLVIVDALLSYAILDAESRFELTSNLTLLLGLCAWFLTSSVLILALGGHLWLLMSDPVELFTRLVFALAASLVATVCASVFAIFLIVPGLYAWARWTIAAPLILLGGSGVFEGLGRSWELTESSRWPLVGVVVILLISQGFASLISLAGPSAIAVPVSLVAGSTVIAFSAAIAVYAFRELSGFTSELAEVFA